MKTVKVFVKLDKSKVESALDVLKNTGFVVDFQSEIELEVFFGTIDESRVSELENADGVLRVWSDIHFKP